MTTIIASIVERFAMELEMPADTDDEWFLDWVLRSPAHSGKHLTAGHLALTSLLDIYTPDDIQSCREYFGGMGAQSMMVRAAFAPEEHTVLEFAKQGAEHLRRVLPPSVTVKQADSYDPSSSAPADLVVLDFGDLTAWKTREGQGHRQLLDRVFAHRPKAVLLTDIACRYLHLHRERYETLLGEGTCVDYPAYLRALLARLEDLYGYTLHEGYWGRWSTVMALVPRTASDVEALLPIPDSPVGLELL